MQIKDYSFFDQEVILSDLPSSICVWDDHGEGFAEFSLYDHGGEFYRARYNTDRYTEEATFADFKQVIQSYMEENNLKRVEIEMDVACGGESLMKRFDVTRSSLTIRTQLSDSVFTSGIPTIVIYSEVASIQATLKVGDQPIFSSTYYAYNNLVNVYELRSILESYMRVNNLAVLTVSLVIHENKAILTRQFIVVFAERMIHGCSATEFLQKHFFTTNTSQLITRTQDVRLFYYTTAGVEHVYSVVYQLADGSIHTTSNSRYFGGTGMRDFDCSYQYVYNLISSGIEESFDILSYSIKVGSRLCRFYISPLPSSHIFMFRNCFNVFEHIAVPAGTIAKSETSFSEAVLAGNIAHYDIQHIRTYEAETPVLIRQHAEWMTQLLQSREIYLADVGSIKAQVLVKEYTSELSDEPGASNSIKFTWQFADQTETLERLSIPSAGIFSQEFNSKFC